MNQFEEWVIREHELKWTGRIERLKWVEYNRPKFEHGYLLRSGLTGLNLRNEASYCFIEGQYLATTMLCLSFIEHQLSAILYEYGDDNAENYSAYKSIEEAHEREIITKEEKELFHRTRKSRNPVAHFQSPSSNDSLDMQAVNRNSNFEDIIEEDAKIALNAMFRIISKLGVGRELRKNLPPEHHPNQTSLMDFK